jgi:hypothetical protein
MSSRWRGPDAPKQALPPSTPEADLDMAGQYLLHLQALYQQCASSPDFRMDANLGELLPPMVWNSGTLPQAKTKVQTSQRIPNPQSQPQHQVSSYLDQNQTPHTASIMVAGPPSSAAPQAHSPASSFQNRPQSQPQSRDKLYSPLSMQTLSGQ